MPKTIIEICREGGVPLRSFPAGELLIEEGVRIGKLYILTEGRVAISKGGIELTEVACPGAVFGEISQLMGTVPMATVRTVSESSFFLADEVEDLLAREPEIYYHIARLLAERLTSVISYLVDIKRQYGDEEGHLGMMDEVLESLIHHQSGRVGDRAQETSN